MVQIRLIVFIPPFGNIDPFIPTIFPPLAVNLFFLLEHITRFTYIPVSKQTQTRIHQKERKGNRHCPQAPDRNMKEIHGVYIFTPSLPSMFSADSFSHSPHATAVSKVPRMSFRPSPYASQQSPGSTDPNVSRFPLIRDILKNYTLSPTDSHPSSWLSEPAVIDAFEKNMPIGYMSQDKTHLDPSGQLLVWGVPTAPWEHCLRIQGLMWTTLKTDLLDLLDGHDM